MEELPCTIARTDNQKAVDEIQRQRAEALQHALHQAWFATALERTKAVFAISSAGVGLSLTLAIQRDAIEGKPTWVHIWLVGSMVLFSVSAWLCIQVFKANTRVVSDMITETDSAASEGLAGRLHFGAQLAFSIAVSCLVFAAVCHGWGLL